MKQAGCLHIPEGRRDHTNPRRSPPPPEFQFGQMRAFSEYAELTYPTIS